MNTLLIFNSILVATCLYFIKDFHSDFKKVSTSLSDLKQNFGEQSIRTNTELKSVKKQVENLENKQS